MPKILGNYCCVAYHDTISRETTETLGGLTVSKFLRAKGVPRGKNSLILTRTGRRVCFASKTNATDRSWHYIGPTSVRCVIRSVLPHAATRTVKLLPVGGRCNVMMYNGAIIQHVPVFYECIIIRTRSGNNDNYRNKSFAASDPSPCRAAHRCRYYYYCYHYYWLWYDRDGS